MKIKVLDAMMGSGKTSRLIEMISKMKADAKIIYITPLLSECHRIAGTEAVKDGTSPVMIGDTDHYYDYSRPLAMRQFKHPMTAQSDKGTKLQSFYELVLMGENIVATHALFNNLTPEINKQIKRFKYILVLDEVLSMYEDYHVLTPKMLQTLMKNEWLYLDSDNLTLKWNHSKGEYENLSILDEIGYLCDSNRLLLINGKAVMIEFPFSSIESFSEVYVATYMFEGSQMHPYLKSYGVDIEIERFGQKPSSVKHLINVIMEPKLNAVGNNTHSLSRSFFDKRTYNETMSTNLYNFFKNKCNNAKSNDRIWTTFKSYKAALGKREYQLQWLACTTKATNDYQHTRAVAYMLNLFPSPNIVKVLAYKGALLDLDKYALSEMVQFIWRSRIRNNEAIQVYIPSSRMRDLFIRWLDDEFEVT